MRISDWSSDVCSSDLRLAGEPGRQIAIGSMLEEIETEGEGETPAPPSPLPSREGPGVDGERSELAPAFEEQPAPPEATPDPSLREKGEVLASPAVRARAKQLGIDLAQVKPSGDHIRHSDLDACLLYGAGQGYRPARTAEQP